MDVSFKKTDQQPVQEKQTAPKNAGQQKAAQEKEPILKASYLKYLLAGMFLGVVFIKGEVISYYRIQEMFRFDSFHMYGIIGSALVVGIISLELLRRMRAKSIDGHSISVPPKKFHWGNLIGGGVFGMGWALTGACPGPIFAHLGIGTTGFAILILSALAGTWTYSLLRPRLPH